MDCHRVVGDSWAIRNQVVSAPNKTMAVAVLLLTPLVTLKEHSKMIEVHRNSNALKRTYGSFLCVLKRVPHHPTIAPMHAQSRLGH